VNSNLKSSSHLEKALSDILIKGEIYSAKGPEVHGESSFKI